MQLIRASPAALERVRARLQSLAPQTVETGRVGHGQVTVGHGPAAFLAAREALAHWATHRSGGLRLYPDDRPPAPDLTVLVCLQASRTSPVCVVFGCRVTQVIDEPRRWGFTYVTLPGHPVRGHELFLVEWHADDRVSFTLRTVSRPGLPLTRLARPVAEWAQRLGGRRYLRAMRAAVSARMQP
ncbi:DUF1990 domain-containing protein [Deinococcus sp.]|uniref:DUF1990 domain-containing protein n=1 Tax=Deinococcus sp. TaxID=47478 RepID=UPI0025BA9DEA|nr:DUF1990 domain-containing protein [Deinococcus sp.]